LPKDRTSIVTVFRVPQTGRYGYSYHFTGYKPHQVIDTCETLQQALDSCDPHLEHVWDEPGPDADAAVLMVSRDFKEGTVMWRMTHLTLAEMQAYRDSDNRAA
jgi:hypothetical protein